VKSCLEWILEITGLLIAVVALIVSCQANDMSKHNQRKLERLECIDKVEVTNKQLISAYRNSLVNATRIHNYLPEKLDGTAIHSDFQTNMIESVQVSKELKRIVKRYKFSCEQRVEDILKNIATMNEMVKGTDTYEQFGGFNSKLQEEHQSNISWLADNDVAEACCGGKK